MKKILIITNHFYPESFKVNDVAFFFAQQGYDVTVVTGVPNYPVGRIFPSYGLFKRNIEFVNGVKVYRLPLIPRGSGKSLRLIINYISYFLSCLIFTPFLLFRYKFDSVLVHETSPIFIGIPAVLVKKIQKIPLYFWVLDLWPESIVATTKISNKYLTNVLNHLVCWLYYNSDKILISSNGFRKSINSKGNFENKLIYFPNWAEDVFENKLIDNSYIPPFPFNDSKINIMYAGNIGEAQDFESITKLISKSVHSNVRWIFVGEGRKYEFLKSYVNENNLDDCVYLLGRLPLGMMPTLYLKADLMLLTLKDSYIFELTVPARMQSYLALGKPVLAMINGEAANIIKEYNCGYVCKAGDIERAANIVSTLDRTDLNQKGDNAKYCYYSCFRKIDQLNKLAQLFESRN